MLYNTVFLKNRNFYHLLRTGDAPCKIYVYTIPGTTNPTFTSCLASDLEPEALPSVEGRSLDLLDDLRDQLVDIVESQSGISTEQASQLVSICAVFAMVAVLCVLKIISCSRSSTTIRRAPLPIPKLLVDACTQSKPLRSTADASTQDTFTDPVVLSAFNQLDAPKDADSGSASQTPRETSTASRSKKSTTRPKISRDYKREPIF